VVVLTVPVNDKAITRVKLAGADSKAEQENAVKESLRGGASQVAGPSQASVEEPEQQSPEEVERIRRQADMDRLKTLDIPQRREIASMDMLGEYGSKVCSAMIVCVSLTSG
jgi:E3 ubiquitin-protein ligase SHPRH